MYKKIVLLIVLSMVSMSAYAGDYGTGNFYPDGGLVGLAGNGIGHVATDPVGAVGTGAEAVIDTTIMMGKGVYVGGATCADVARSGIVHVATDPVGAVGTGAEAVIDTTIKGGKAVIKAGSVCINTVIAGGGALIKDPIGASTTAIDAVIGTAVKSICAVVTVTLGK